MLEAIFAPQSVAIVGASPDPSKLGHRVLRNIVDNDFTGRLFPIHPTAPRVLDLPAYPSVTAIPDPVDLAVIVVPSPAVLPVVDECGAKGVRGEPPADIAAAEEVVLRVSQLVSDFSEIVEMDINPLVVHNQGEGAIVLDARIILQG